MTDSNPRLTLEFDSVGMAKLNELVVLTKAKDRAEVIRNALQFYEWGVQDTLRGLTIGSVSGDRILYSVTPKMGAVKIAEAEPHG